MIGRVPGGVMGVGTGGERETPDVERGRGREGPPTGVEEIWRRENSRH